jgi:hypothetical protein
VGTLRRAGKTVTPSRTPAPRAGKWTPSRSPRMPAGKWTPPKVGDGTLAPWAVYGVNFTVSTSPSCMT